MIGLNEMAIQAEVEYRRERARGYRTDGQVVRSNRRALRRRGRHHRASGPGPLDQ